MNSRTISVGVAGALASVLWAASASAAIINACGPNVCYEYDDAQGGAALTGLPTLVGDSMQFNPQVFLALSANGAGLVQVGGNPAGMFYFSRVYTADPGDEITTFTVAETFDYEIIGGDSVEAILDLTAQQGIGIASDSNNFLVAGDTGGFQVGSVMAQIFPTLSFGFPANDMQLWIVNTLRATTTESGELAFIQKKFTLATATVMNSMVVPVPAAVWLLGSALGLLGWMRRVR